MSLAPHRGQEWNLILMGEKPFAVVELKKDPEQYNYVLTHLELFEVIEKSTPEGREVRFWKKGSEEGRLANFKYTNLVNRSIEFIDRYGQEWYTREMGQVFGYTEQQIQDFIDGSTKCDCTKCRGMSRE